MGRRARRHARKAERKFTSWSFQSIATAPVTEITSRKALAKLLRKRPDMTYAPIEIVLDWLRGQHRATATPELINSVRFAR